MQMLTLTREQFAHLLPHRGAMCLLDRVISWDAAGIVCASNSHHCADHPLLAHGQLLALAGIEYSAQAMALHGALVGRADGVGVGAPGMLASLRQVTVHVPLLNVIRSELLVHAEQLVRQQHHLLYAFRVEGDGGVLLQGRAAIALGATGHA
jgi:predicted hotdog family 3-hydroxylacyl-ACP dehydratase